jgi:hypothetical protein
MSAGVAQVVRTRDDQVALLRAWAHLYGTADTASALSAHALVLARALYDADLVDEDAFFAWEATATHSALARRLAPFLTWLREAEEESD